MAQRDPRLLTGRLALSQQREQRSEPGVGLGLLGGEARRALVVGEGAETVAAQQGEFAEQVLHLGAIVRCALDGEDARGGIEIAAPDELARANER